MPIYSCVNAFPTKTTEPRTVRYPAADCSPEVQLEQYNSMNSEFDKTASASCLPSKRACWLCRDYKKNPSNLTCAHQQQHEPETRRTTTPPPAVLGVSLFLFWIVHCFLVFFLFAVALCPHCSATPAIAALDCDDVRCERRAISKLPLVSHFRRQQHIGRQRLRVLAASSGPRAHQSSARLQKRTDGRKQV